ncbi:MAG TPA: zinc-ribbon domain-containing protein [Verrucomicrobiales bacterium]|jgi:hypothetical protein|nr:zinc-ribbon domain-containing protein [Verrucomicrobiales bacterium]
MMKASRKTRKEKTSVPAYPPPGAIRVNFEKLRSTSWVPEPFREYYVDLPFVCKDCGTQEVWTAQQQQWWYEVAQGTIETTAIRCRACRKANAKMKEAALDARRARAKMKAAETAGELARQPEILALLRKPLQQLRLKSRIEKALLEQGIDTVARLVACDPEVCPPQMSSTDWEDLKRTLKSFGIPLVGLPVLPP